jgi:hypothetical protein
MGGGLMPGFGSAPPEPQQKAAKPSNEPETHAAPGAEDNVVAPGGEPSLPEEPLKLRRRTLERVGTDLLPAWQEQGRGRRTTYGFYGPYYTEESGRYSFKLLFPLWAERKQPSRTDPLKVDRATLYGGLYYNRRSAERSDDVLFPLFWNLVDERKKSRTTVIGPLVNRIAPDERDDWVVPLYFGGKRKQGGYTQSAESKYEVIPPLLHYYKYDDRKLSYVNVWGPYYREHTQKRDMFHLFPLYFSIWGKSERHTTLLPFFHYGHDEKSSLFVNPLFLSATGEKGESTFVTWGYARHRGRTELDMITPLFWQYRDPDIQLTQNVLFPFFYSRTSPRESTHAVFPFFARSQRFGISTTTFVTPFFQHTHGIRGWSTNLHPFLYVGREATSTHTVIAPFFWDFASPTSRSTVAFPAYWRFSNEKEVSQLVGNVYYHEAKLSTGTDWEVHVFPAFSYGETPDGHWWNVLYGLAGYTRRGSLVKVRTLWIPITVSGTEQ